MTTDAPGRTCQLCSISLTLTLATEVIICLAFINKHVRCIKPDRRQTTLKQPNKESILAFFSKETIASVHVEHEKKFSEFIGKEPKMKTIPACFEAPFFVITRALGIYVLELWTTL